jgi:hypothetical protein
MNGTPNPNCIPPPDPPADSPVSSSAGSPGDEPEIDLRDVDRLANAAEDSLANLRYIAETIERMAIEMDRPELDGVLAELADRLATLSVLINKETDTVECGLKLADRLLEQLHDSLDAKSEAIDELTSQAERLNRDSADGRQAESALSTIIDRTRKMRQALKAAAVVASVEYRRFQ